MLALVLEITTAAVIGQNVYSFNGEVKLQLVGGPIGLKLSYCFAKVYMLYWTNYMLMAITLPCKR